MIVDNLDIGTPAAVSCRSIKTSPLFGDDLGSYVNYVILEYHLRLMYVLVSARSINFNENPNETEPVSITFSRATYSILQISLNLS